MKSCWHVLLTLSTVILQVRGGYDCRRNGLECKNSRICDKSTGVCGCALEYETFDCGVLTADKDNCTDPTVCGPNGVCYDAAGSCYCNWDFYGPTCEYEQSALNCTDVAMSINITLPTTFAGIVYANQGRDNCFITPDISASYTLFSTVLSFDGSGCGQYVTKSKGLNGDKYEASIVVAYSLNYYTSLDEVYVFTCEHQADNITMYASLGTVKLNERGNLTESKKNTSYSPVVFTIQDGEGNPLAKPLHVGAQFSLVFSLPDFTVYNKIRIQYCEANNTLPDTPKKFLLLKDGCPTKTARSVLPQLQETITLTGADGDYPGVRQKVKAFKFIDSDNVAFSCRVKVCVQGDLSCDLLPCDGSAAAPAAATRKRRDTYAESLAQYVDVEIARKRRDVSPSMEDEFSAVIKVIDPFMGGSEEQGAAATTQECLATTEIMVVVIVMACTIFILLIAICILAMRMMRSRSRVKDGDTRRFCQSRVFQIPRAKINEQGEF